MNQTQLQNRIARLKLVDFEAFCTRFGVDGGALDGRTQAEKASEFVTEMMRQGRLPEIAAAMAGPEAPPVSQTAELEAALSWLDDIAAGKGAPVEEPPTYAWPSSLHDTPMEDALDTLEGLDTAVFEENVTMAWPGDDEITSPALPATNPYVTHLPVTADPMFFGREREITYLVSRLEKMESTAVIGLRHIGKSSLLLHLCRHAPTPDYLMASIDLRDGRFAKAVDLLNNILRQWERPVVVEVKKGKLLPGRDYRALGRTLMPNLVKVDDFSNRVRALRRSGYRPVICLDGFDQLAQRPSQMTGEFFEIWGKLAVEGVLAFVIAATQPVPFLLKQNGLKSEYGKNFSMLPLGLLSLQAAQALLSAPAAGFGVKVPEAAVSHLLDLCGAHPYYLQMGGFFLFDSLRLHQYQPEKVADSFTWQAEPAWRALWRSLNDRHKHLLLTPLPENAPLVVSRQYRALTQLGLLRPVDGRLRLFSRGFANWLAAEEKRPSPPKTPPPALDGSDKEETAEKPGFGKRLKGLFSSKEGD